MSTLTLAICARNAQDIIGGCLDSIRSQTVAPDEVIVALDDLSDPTKPVAEAYGTRVLASNATGLYEARNAVLDACTTDYLAFTDADCVLVPEWVERAKAVLDAKPDVAAGTGRHPPIGERTFASWLHHMWFVVETQNTGYTDGVIGGNSYFRTEALREVGGWLSLPRHSAAEDVYISIALTNAGHRIWFEEGCAAQHHYETDLKGLMRKSVMMGRDIVVMIRAARWRNGMWQYTLSILIAALMFLNGILFFLLWINPWAGAVMTLLPLIATFLFLWRRFGSLSAAAPRWVARWIVIWPYAWGIAKGLLAMVPDDARRPRRRRLKICLACSHGGHLTEMKQLDEAFEGHDTFYFTYDADTTRRLPNAYTVPNMARNPIEFIKNLFRVRRIFKKERPNLVVSTGAEIAIPVVLVAKLYRIPAVYIECGAQTTHPSITGRLMCRLADRFFVQWQELVHVYGPRAVFRGSLIDEDKPFEGDRSRERRMTVSLVQPAHLSGFSSDQPPMGLAYIASVLQQSGCSVRLIDANVEKLDTDQVRRIIVQQNPDILCVTVTTPLVPGALALVRAVRKVMPSPPKFVAGGPHPTVAPEELLGPDGFDFAVRGEGEGTIAELVEALDTGSPFEDITGLTWYHDGEIVQNAERELCEDLAELPYPDWSIFPLRQYSSLARRNAFCLPIMTSRGCPYGCTFCYKGVYGSRLRMREPEDVVNEWQFLAERYGAQEIAVIDDNFTMWPERAIAICDVLIERGLDRVPWSTTNGIRVNHAEPEVLERMKQAGCYRVYFGIESGVQRILDTIEKRITLEQVDTAVRAAKDAGLEVGGYFILGNLGETAADMDATVDYALGLDLDMVQFTIATPYPGTEMYRQVCEDGELLIDSWEDLATYGQLVFRMGEVTPELVAGKYRTALRRFYFRPRFVLRQLRQAMTWTGFKHRVLGAWVLAKMTLIGRRTG